MKLRESKWFTFVRERFSFGKFVLFAFVVFIIFMDENSCIQRAKYDKEINSLNQQIATENEKTEYYNERSKELQNNKELIEQIAREEILMCKPHEDIYIIEESPNTK